MTRRQTPRDEPGRRQKTFEPPHSRRPRLPRWQQLVVLGMLVVAGVFLALRDPALLRPTIDMLAGRGMDPADTLVRDRPAEEAVLERRRQGLNALILAAARGPLVSHDANRMLFVVDQVLVSQLLATQFPREYVIDDTYRIWVTGARIAFEDGLALVRLDGRASLIGADENVFADVAVFGDLEVLRDQPSAAVLRTRINLLAVDARRVEVVVSGRRDADELVERLGRARLSAFAALASGLEIPVRHEHEIELPAVVDGPVRIEGTTLPLRLALADVHAFRGRLWISMAASLDAAPPLASAPHRHAALPAVDARVPPAERIARLEQDVGALRARLAEVVGPDAVIEKGARSEGHVTAAVSPALFEAVVRRIAAHYLDRVAIQLDDLHVDRAGVIHKDTFLGKVKAGEWTADVTFSRVRGLLRAGEPEVRLPGGNRVTVELPVHLERGSGAARVHFQWDSRAVVNLFCRDFEVTEEVEGRVAPRGYPVTGRFTMSAGRDELVARPAFDDRFRIHPELDEVSWAVVERALRAQDKVERCGMGLDPPEVLAQLKALVDAGFVVKLPQKLFRPVSLPTRLTPTVNVQGRDVEVELTQSRLDAGPDGVWYGVWVKAGVPGPRAAGASVD